MRQRILSALARHADGATSKEIADEIGEKHTRVSQLLGQLNDAGLTTRIRRARPPSVNIEFVYRIKPQAEAVEIAPRIFTGPVRIAEREIATT